MTRLGTSCAALLTIVLVGCGASPEATEDIATCREYITTHADSPALSDAEIGNFVSRLNDPELQSTMRTAQSALAGLRKGNVRPVEALVAGNKASSACSAFIEENGG